MTLNLQKVSNNTKSKSSVMIGSRPTLIAVPPMRFLIMDAPRQSNLHLYIKEMKKHSVSDVVRVCEPTYHSAELDSAGMGLHEMEYADGHAPSRELIDKWLGLVEDTFYKESSNANAKCIAVHCVAGLGRAPVMVAIALIEFANYDPVEAVALIRNHRRGAINEKQLNYLEGYKRHWKRSAGVGESSCCVIL
jgi:protein tyrosine phosphatase type 4A